METPACPLCEQVGTVQWLDEAYAYVCGECATIVADAPLDVVEQPEGVVPPPPRLPRWWVYDRASARHAHEQRRARHATEMVQGAVQQCEAVVSRVRKSQSRRGTLHHLCRVARASLFVRMAR